MGTGLDRNVIEAYTFIAKHYSEESDDGSDRIYIFGYSRGAHTARVLAAFIYNVGLLRPEQLHLVGAALTAYKKADPQDYDNEVSHIRRTLQPRTVPIEFIGAWDTVSSVIVPGSKTIMPTAEALPNTRVNPGVKAFRHAMSIDEARYMFRLDMWQEDQEFQPNPFSQGNASCLAPL